MQNTKYWFFKYMLLGKNLDYFYSRQQMPKLTDVPISNGLTQLQEMMQLAQKPN